MSDETIHEWDAAYVLGALSAEDRRRFEAHLAECAECRAAVGELAGIPALLGRVPASALEGTSPDAGETVEPPPGPPPTLLPRLAHRVRRRRLTRRWAAAGASVLAAAAIAGAVVLPLTDGAPPAEPGTRIALEQATPTPLSATVSLSSKRWGTEITMTCDYGGTPGAYATTADYELYVTDAAGEATRVASWSAWPGAEIHASGSVDVPKAQLRTVEVRDAATDAVLLRSPVK